MSVSSPDYFVLLAAVFFLYWAVRGSRLAAIAVILFANYFFYAKWDLVYLALIPAASTCDYLIGAAIQRPNKCLRRVLVTASILMNIGLLASSNTCRFSEVAPPHPEWHWTLPLSLSFYVFQALTYTIDLYRRDAKGLAAIWRIWRRCRSFPTMLAGPITRVSNLMRISSKSPRSSNAAGRRPRAVSDRAGPGEEADDRGFSGG